MKNPDVVGKFTIRTREGVYLGPATHGDGYRIFMHDTQKFICSRDVYFLEDKGRPKIIDSPMVEISEDDDSLFEM